MPKQKHAQERKQTPSRFTQYLAAGAASMATFSTGIVFGWPAQITDDLLDGVLGFPITTDELGWICSISSIGAAILTLVVGHLCDAIGRKITMLLMILVFEVGWLLIVFANSVWMLILGRFITGMCSGAYCVTVSTYIGEIAQKDVRGKLGGLTQLMISCGILYANLSGAFLPIRAHFGVCAVMPLHFGLAFFSMPESPVYLVLKGKIKEAKASLKRLTGQDDVEEELEELKRRVESERVKSSLADLLKKRSVKKAFFIGIGLAVLKVFTGIDSVTSYLSHIFGKTDTPLRPQVAAIIFAVFQVVGFVPSTLLVDRAGRKVLLVLSELLMGLCLGAIAVCISVGDGSTVLSYIPIVALCLYTVAFAVGIGPIGWIIMAEIFEEKIRGPAISFCTFLIWALAFASVKTFVVLEDVSELSVPLFIYCGVCLAGVAFVFVIVKETKNKSSEEIEVMLSK